MEHFTEVNQVDYLFGSATGATVTVYQWPNVDMSGYDAAAFIITTPWLTQATATAAANECIVQCAVYTATAATSTALTALSSATASFGSTSGGQINGAKALIVTINTASTGTTFSIQGKGFKVDSTADTTGLTILGATSAITNATCASSLSCIINATNNTFSSYLVAATDLPVGATMLSSNSVYIRPKEVGSFSLSATGFYGATANKGVLVAGEFEAVINVPAMKMKGARYITLGINSSGLPTPFYVNLIRSRASNNPPSNAGLAVNTKIGSTTT